MQNINGKKLSIKPYSGPVIKTLNIGILKPCSEACGHC